MATNWHAGTRAAYRLTTAEIVYCMPDHPDLLQSYIWQDLDLAPRYPVLHRFLRFWERTIEGRLKLVRVASADLGGPPRFRHLTGTFELN